LPKSEAKDAAKGGIKGHRRLAAVVFVVPGPAPQGLILRSALSKSKRVLGG